MISRCRSHPDAGRFCSARGAMLAASRARLGRVEPAGGSVHPGWQSRRPEAARAIPSTKVFVHAGTYRPRAKGQALIWFKRGSRHHASGSGRVDPSRRQSEVADRDAPSSLPSSPTGLSAGVTRTPGAGFRSPARNFTPIRRLSPIESDYGGRRRSSKPTAAHQDLRALVPDARV